MKKSAVTPREVIQEINDVSRYMNANRDRALGETDRTGRHHDEQVTPEDGTEASGELEGE